MSFIIKTSAHHHRLNEVNSIQDIFAFLNDAVLAKEDDLFERITLEINLFLYIQKNKTLCWIFTDLKLGKIGTSHGFILNPLIFVEQRGTSMRCMGGDLGRGAQERCISYKLNCSTIWKLTASCISGHTSVRVRCISVLNLCTVLLQWQCSEAKFFDLRIPDKAVVTLAHCQAENYSPLLGNKQRNVDSDRDAHSQKRSSMILYDKLAK